MHRGCRLLLIMPVALLAGCTWLGVSVGTNGKCDKETVGGITSPGGQWKAVTARNICGTGDTKWSMTTVELANGQGQGGLTIFTAYDMHGSTQPVQWPNIKVDWKSDAELWIVYPPGYQITCNGTADRNVAVHCADATIVR